MFVRSGQKLIERKDVRNEAGERYSLCGWYSVFLPDLIISKIERISEVHVTENIGISNVKQLDLIYRQDRQMGSTKTLSYKKATI